MSMSRIKHKHFVGISEKLTYTFRGVHHSYMYINRHLVVVGATTTQLTKSTRLIHALCALTLRYANQHDNIEDSFIYESIVRRALCVLDGASIVYTIFCITKQKPTVCLRLWSKDARPPNNRSDCIWWVYVLYHIWQFSFSIGVSGVLLMCGHCVILGFLYDYLVVGDLVRLIIKFKTI